MSGSSQSLTKLFVLLAFVSLFGGSQAKIKSTAILFRHGQRTPQTSYPNLPCSLCDDIGLGQLTKVGSQELYENGLLLNLKYDHLLTDFFRLSNMKIMSSAPERTIMSLQSFMAGFFRPPLSNPNLPILWQPFFHDIDYDGRIVYINYDFATCPTFWNKMFGMLYNPPERYANWLNEDKEAFKEIAALLGIPAFDDLQSVIMVTDALKAVQYVEPNTPQWAIDAYENTMAKYGELVKTIFHVNELMIKIRGGPLVTEIVNNMVAHANNDAIAKNVLIYSAHDSTIASFSYALGVENQIPAEISYSDTMMVDLVEKGSGLNVEVIYMDNGKLIPRKIAMNVPGCGTSCSLDTFRTAMQNMMVDDLDQLCGL